MDSSILELKEALALLTDFNQSWDYGSNGADNNGFAHASQICRRLSENFEGANSTLQEGWATAADLFYRLYQLILDQFGAMYDDITLFTDETYQAEQAAKAAVEAANDAASSILDELGLSDQPTGSDTGTSTQTGYYSGHNSN